MKLEDIETLADGQRYITEHTPQPVARWWGLQCPRCRRRFFNSLFGTWANYFSHYAEHVTDDIRNEPE